MSTPAHVTETDGESSKPDSAERSEQKIQSGYATQPEKVSDPSPGYDDDSGEEWETIGYEETAEGRKAKGMAFGHFQIKRKKKRLFSYHWNVRKY